MAVRPSLAFSCALVVAGIADDALAQQTGSPLTLSGTMRTAVALSASVPGMVPVTDTLPAGTTSATGFSLAAQTSPGNPFLMSAEVFSHIAWTTNSRQAQINATESVNATAPMPAGGNAFSTMHEIVVTVVPAANIMAEALIEWRGNSSGSATMRAEVDLLDDGSVDFRANSTPVSSTVVPLMTTGAQPFNILIRRSILASGAGASADAQLRITLRPRFSSTLGRGCWGGAVVTASAELSGSLRISVVDTIVGQTPGGANVLLLGPLQPAPIPLPFSLPLAGTVCTLGVVPAIVIPASTGQTLFTLQTPGFVPLSLRPFTVYAQSLGVTPGPTFHSSGTSSFEFR